MCTAREEDIDIDGEGQDEDTSRSGSLEACAEKGEDSGKVNPPTKLQIFKMRRKKKAFFFTCDHFLPNIVGKYRFRNFSSQMMMSSLATRSDEALMYLFLENNWERWSDMSKSRPPLKESTISTKYSYRGNKAEEFGGWTEEGIKRFNELMEQVENDRNSWYASGVEEEYLLYRQEKQNGKKHKLEVDNGRRQRDLVKPMHDLFALDSLDGCDGNEESNSCSGSDKEQVVQLDGDNSGDECSDGDNEEVTETLVASKENRSQSSCNEKQKRTRSIVMTGGSDTSDDEEGLQKKLQKTQNVTTRKKKIEKESSGVGMKKRRNRGHR